jgi:predicted peroxiredoxin
MKVTYFITTGKSDATRASVPWHLAVNGSAENGDEVSLILGGDAADLLDRGVRDSMQGLGLPSMKELSEKARASSVPIFV